MRRLVCAFVVHNQEKSGFLVAKPIWCWSPGFWPPPGYAPARTYPMAVILKRNCWYVEKMIIYYIHYSLSAPPSTTSGTTSTDPILSRMEKKFNENAPDKLASDFKKIYDLEWKSAYHELEKHYKMKDQQITEVLGAIARVRWKSEDTYENQLMRHKRSAKAQASLRLCAVSPKPSLFAYKKYKSRWRPRPIFRYLAPLDSCVCMFKALLNAYTY